MDWLNPSHWLDSIVTWLSSQFLNAFDAIFNLLAHGLLRTPQVAGMPQVRALTGKSIWVVDGIFVMFFVAAGLLQIVAGGNERARYTAKDLLPRCVVGFIAAHFSWLLCAQATDLANGLTGAVTGDQVDGTGALKAVRDQVTGSARNYPSPMLLAIVLALIVLLLATVFLSLVGRLGLLLVLTAFAPLALACHALPHTEGVARLWWRSYLGCLAIPVLQAFTLQAGAWMLTDPQMMAGLGVRGGDAAVVNLFTVVVLLWTTVKVPGLMRRFVTQSGRSPNVVSTVIRVVITQQVAKLVGIGRGGRAASR
jgi:hypothetical protein